jgi:indolepyruvate decarboxylase
VINPDNCVIEMERVIAEARRNNQPAYIVVPSDYALAPIRPVDVRPVTIKSNETSLQKAVAAITERLKSAKSVVALPAFTISRLGLQKEARAAIEAIGCPFATTSMEKCIIDESHPQFAGMYSGALSTKGTREIVEDAELVLDMGGVSLNDETTMGFSTHLDLARFISIGLNDVRVGDQLFGSVRIADVLASLVKFKSSSARYKRPSQDAPRVNGKPSDKITMDALYARYAAFIRPGDNVVLESGSSSFGVSPMPLANDVQVHIQMLWGSIGWATGATFGIALANRNRKTILITGEGSHQLTANDIGNMGRFGANPIIFVLNNDGYMVKRALELNPDWSYNDLAKWRYADLPHALGCTAWFTARVETLGELDAALKVARESKSGAYIEVIGGRMDMPKGLAFAHTRLKDLYGDTP